MHSDIEDFSTQTLLDEVENRKARVLNRRCPYCSAPLNSHTCKYAGRVHAYHELQPNLVSAAEKVPIRKSR